MIGCRGPTRTDRVTDKSLCLHETQYCTFVYSTSNGSAGSPYGSETKLFCIRIQRLYELKERNGGPTTWSVHRNLSHRLVAWTKSTVLHPILSVRGIAILMPDSIRSLEPWTDSSISLTQKHPRKDGGPTLCRSTDLGDRQTNPGFSYHE